MFTLVKSYLGYREPAGDEHSEEECCRDVEVGPETGGQTSSTLGGSRPLECPVDCNLYADFAEKFYIAPSRETQTVLVYPAALQAEVNGVAIWDEWRRDDEDGGVERLSGILKIYEHLFAHEQPHLRLARYLGPTISGYRLERLDPGPLPSLDNLPPAGEEDEVLALYQRWALQILSALRYIHSKGIIANSIAEEAIWLRSDLSIAFAGLTNAGSVNLGVLKGHWGSGVQLACQWEAATYQIETPYTEAEAGRPKCDLFHWAVLVYRWMTGHASPLCDGVEITLTDKFQAKERAVADGCFESWPEIEANLLGPVLVKAWKGEFETAGEALKAVQELVVASGRTLSPACDDEIDGLDWQRSFETFTDAKGYMAMRLRNQSKERSRIEKP